MIEPSDSTLTFRELNEWSNQAAQFFRLHGLRRGDVVSLVMENRAEFVVLAWAAARPGLDYVGVSTHLAEIEPRYIIEDSGSVAVFVSQRFLGLADSAWGVRLKVAVDRHEYSPGWTHFATETAANGYRRCSYAC